MNVVEKVKLLKIIAIFIVVLGFQGCAIIEQIIEEIKIGIEDTTGYFSNTKKINGRTFKEDLGKFKSDLNATLKSMGLENLIIKNAADPNSKYIRSDKNGRHVYTGTGKPVKNLKNAEKKYSHMIAKAANTYNVERALIFAIIRAESAFNPYAVSPVGAEGLMQLMPTTAKMLGVKNAFDPEQNIMGGTLYLRLLSKEFNDRRLIVAAYNAGPGNVKKYGHTIPPFSETKNYVKKVMIYCDLYSVS